MFCDDICGKEMYIVQSADLQHFSCNNLLIMLGFVTIFVRRGARGGAHKFTYNVRNALSGKPELSVMILRPDLQFGVSAILKRRLKYECVMFATQRDGCKMANTFQHLVKA